jgi:hypothetical protein
MVLRSILLSIFFVFFLGGVWLILYIPRCPVCSVRVQSVGEDVRPWGRSGVDAVFYYECPRCAWATERRYTITHIE